MLTLENHVLMDRTFDSGGLAPFLESNGYLVHVQETDSPCEEFGRYVSEHRERMNGYLIITNDCSRYSGFISNNIIKYNGNAEKLLRQIEWILGKNTLKNMTGNTFFISDTHFSHGNIIKYCNRPWNGGRGTDGEIAVRPEDVSAMNEEIVKRWNSVVGKDDLVWHLGDFALGDRNRIPDLVSRLNGRINLVMGNHDTKNLGFYYDCGFNRVYDHPVILNKFIVLSHEPMEFLTPNAPWFNIFGHVHDSDHYKTVSKSSCCVCVERWDYKPVSWNTIRESSEHAE